MRTITEGTWSGYRSSQRRVVHRTVHKGRSPYAAIDAVEYSDGTTLDLTHREAKPREKVQEIHGYDSLLDKFAARGMCGFCRVDDFYTKEARP